MISKRHFERVSGLIDSKKVVSGGRYDRDSLKIEPTVMTDVTWDDKVMGEEIFGPLMPVLTYENIEEVITKINSQDKPLALYIYS